VQEFDNGPWAKGEMPKNSSKGGPFCQSFLQVVFSDNLLGHVVLSGKNF
jgi:hypothetical protein